MSAAMSSSGLEYGPIVMEGLRLVVRRVLERVAAEGLTQDHHFYITFRTTYPGVVLPPRLLERYPEEITIVLRTHFWELEVTEEHFSVGLSFDGQRERLTVPFTSVLRFVDPSVQFGLELQPPPPPPVEVAAETPEEESLGENVVRLDRFRPR